MKKETVEEKVIITTYTCEVCKKQSRSEYVITRCEKMHEQGECAHGKYTYHLEYNTVVQIKCSGCGIKLESTSMNMIYDNSEALGKVFCILKENNTR